MPDGVTAQPDIAPPDPAPRRFANFPRRLNALSIDTLIVVGSLGLLIVMGAQAPAPLRLLCGVLVWVVVLGYEPLMVWWYGGTLGHRAMNLWVVDTSTDANVSLGRAFVRFALKAVLGIVSFITMNVTRRHQAVHDYVTRSAVCIRDVSRADPADYTLERRMAATDGE